MSSIVAAALRSAAKPQAYSRLSAVSFRTSSARNYSSTVHDNDPDTLELEKKRNLSNTQHKTSTPHPQAPGWNECLATTSEASVKADRLESTSNLHDLQRQTVEYVQSRRDPDDRLTSTTATYTHDEVQGPLAGQKITRDTLKEEKTEVQEPCGQSPGRKARQSRKS